MPWLDRLLTDHIFQAVHLHVALRYCAFAPPTKRTTSSLATWQMRKVKELMLDDLSVNISTDDLAFACGLSAGYFIRSFRGTVGLTPHRWRTYQRVDRAKALLALTEDAICDIALTCSFSSQSHFTRIFVAVTGISPATYRRLLRSHPTATAAES